MLAFFLVWGCAIAARLAQFQIVQHQRLSEAPIYQKEVPIPVLRANIYDSRMAELAASVMANTVLAEPGKIPDIPAAATALSPLLGIDPKTLIVGMADPAHQKYFVLKKRIDSGLAARIKALGLQGIYFEDCPLRVYPNRNLASHTLGFVDANGNGVAGLEKQYNNGLSGKQGKAVCEVDAVGRCYSQKTVAPPVPGHSLVLSIDGFLQNIAERELLSGVRRARAKAGVAIVMESETGRILALANIPDFDCNTYGQYDQKVWRNRAIQDQFEPGSTLKVVVGSAALDAQVVGPNELINCQMGSFKIGGHTFHDHKPYGLLTFGEVLEQSSNIGAIKLGLRLGEERLYNSLRSFGFGARTGIDLPAEATGLVRERRKWSALSIASISFGQEVSVTSMQILIAINAIANGGYRVRPSVVDRVINSGGESVRTRTVERVRIMRPGTAAAVRSAFEGVVLRGTAKKAALEGYRAAGKTGTAQKAEGRHFSRTKYVASFIGFAPLPQPRVTILVQIDEPRASIYGGDVAAPVFQKIAQEVLLRLHVPQDMDLLLAEDTPRKGSMSIASRPLR